MPLIRTPSTVMTGKCQVLPLPHCVELRCVMQRRWHALHTAALISAPLCVMPPCPRTSSNTISVTQLLKRGDDFAPDTASARASSAATNNPDHRYYNMTAQQIRQQWERDRLNGVAVHAAIQAALTSPGGLEGYISSLPRDSPMQTTLRQVARFLCDHPDWEVAAVEWAIFSQRLGLCGTVDAAFWKPDGTLVLVDWKTSSTPNASYKRRAWSKQLCGYKVVLENEYDVVVSHLVVVAVHAALPHYVLPAVQDRSDDVSAAFAQRWEQLQAGHATSTTTAVSPGPPAVRRSVNASGQWTPNAKTPWAAYDDPFVASSGDVRLRDGRLWCCAAATHEGSTRACAFAEEFGLPCRHILAVQQLLAGGDDLPLVRFALRS